MDMLDLWIVVGDSPFFLKVFSAEWRVLGGLLFVFRFLSSYLVNRVKFFGIKMAKYLRIIVLHISKKSRTFALAKK